MNCLECERIKNKKHLIYEDASVAAFLEEKPAAQGQLVILPKEHAPIIEMIPDEVIGHIFNVANTLATVCFEVLGAHGTNIMIKNGVPAGQKTPHAQVEIIPRFENDGINMQWQTMKVTEDDLNTAQLMLKDQLEKPIEKKEEKKAEPIQETEEIPEEDNYMLKQLERIP